MVLPAAWSKALRSPGGTNGLIASGALLVITPLLFFGGPDPTSPRLFLSTWSLGHLILFGALAVWVVHRCPTDWPWYTHWLFTLGVTALLGGLAEIVQGIFGRTPSFIDWSWDLLGAAIGLVFLRILPRNKLGALALSSVVLLFLGTILAPRFLIAMDDAIAARQFPDLATLESPLELSRWRGRDYLRITSDHVHDGERSLEVTLPPGLYSGTTLAHFPRDWTEYKGLEFYAFNPDATALPVTVKIYDKIHDTLGHHYYDRYNGRRTLRPGWTRIFVDLQEVRYAPKAREMDMSQIRHVQIFTEHLKTKRLIYLDSFRLLAERPSRP